MNNFSTTATWDIRINCECPSCKEFVNLLDFPDFWDSNHHLDIPENGTSASRNLEVVCPECGHEFKVDLEY